MPLDHDLLAELPHLLSPYPGAWSTGPVVADDVVVVAEDPGITRLEWSPSTGEVSVRDLGDGSRSVVNATLTAFTACCRLFTAAVAESQRIDEDADDDDADRLHEAHGSALLDALHGVDPGAVSDENGLWAVAAEEIGYGML